MTRMYTAGVIGEVRVEAVFALIRMKMRSDSIDKTPTAYSRCPQSG